MRLLWNHIQNARDSLRSNRLRSFLTMLGIMIGVASITTILALSGGASKIVGDQVDELGRNIAVVRPGAPLTKGPADLSTIPLQSSYAASTLTMMDVDKIAEIKEVAAVAPLMHLSVNAKSESRTLSNTAILATSPALEKIIGLDVRDGQFLDDRLYIQTAVIGAQLSIELFGTEQSIGKTFSIKDQTFTVVGILKRTNQPINYNNVDLDQAAIINLNAGRILNNGAIQVHQINVQSESVASLSGVIAQMNQVLLKTHFGENDFSVLSGEEIAQPTSRLFFAIAGVTAAIAGISLLVGGIGIMNIMLVSVAERTREIGIRKALGASNGDIVWQFLIESLALSIGGGILGYALGYVLAFIISTFLTFDPILNLDIVAIAFIISLFIGVLFGIYPAIRAARKDPINALRQYE